MRSSRRTTTLRTAAVLTGAAAVLALPVGSAFAQSPAGPPEPEVLPGIEQPPVKERGRVFLATVQLADGSVARVYRVGDRHVEADVLARGTRLDTLVSKGGKRAYGQNNGLHVVLRPDGTVTSWIEGGGKPKPKPKPKGEKEAPVRIDLPDGRIAKLFDGPKGKRAEIFTPHGKVVARIDLKHPGAFDGGWTYRLVQDGGRVKFVVIDGRSGGDSRVYDFADGKLIEEYTAEAAATRTPVRVVPKDGVKAGAEGAGTAPEPDTPVLVAAGGGMAAVGAAGLGFAMRGRGRG